MVTVSCSQCWNVDIRAMTFLKMLMITMMRTTWTTKENFLFKWMRLAFMATRSVFSFHKRTEILTTQCLFILLHRKWRGMNQENIFIGRKDRKEIKTEKQNRRPINASHVKKNRQNKVIGVATHPRQHPHRGGQDTDECRLLTIEDSTAERRFHCIVLQLAVDFFFTSIHELFPRRDDVTWYFSSLTHLVWTLPKKTGYHLCSQLFYVDGTDSYH